MSVTYVVHLGRNELLIMSLRFSVLNAVSLMRVLFYPVLEIFKWISAENMKQKHRIQMKKENLSFLPEYTSDQSSYIPAAAPLFLFSLARHIRIYHFCRQSFIYQIKILVINCVTGCITNMHHFKFNALILSRSCQLYSTPTPYYIVSDKPFCQGLSSAWQFVYTLKEMLSKLINI